MPLMTSLTLGLAPWLPEPHIVGKIRWVLGGAKDMAAMHWSDLLMHGAPWMWLAYPLVAVFVMPKLVPAATAAPAAEPNK